jgi:hypothetical protein
MVTATPLSLLALLIGFAAWYVPVSLQESYVLSQKTTAKIRWVVCSSQAVYGALIIAFLLKH